MEDLECSSNRLNPLDLGIIVEHVMGYLGPQYALPCRVVNSLWNAQASSILNDRWCIKLSNDNVGEYLRLTKAKVKANNNETRSQDKYKSPSLELHLCIDYTASSGEEATIAALEIACQDGRQEFTSLKCTFGDTGITKSFLCLIWACKDTLRQLSLHYTKPNTFNRTEHPINLPALKSVSLEYVDVNEVAIRKIQTLWSKAAGLNTVRLRQRGRLGFGVQPAFILGDCKSFPTHQIVHLDVNITKVMELNSFRKPKFDRLQTMRLSVTGAEDISEPSPSITRIIEDNCPMLKSLDVIDLTPRPSHPFLPLMCVLFGPANPTFLQELPTFSKLCHLGVHLQAAPVLDPNANPTNNNNIILNRAEAYRVLQLMSDCADLSSIALNMDACLALAQWNKFLNPNSNLPEEYRTVRQPTVTKLTLAVSRAAVPVRVDAEMLHSITRLLNEVYPALQELVVNLEAGESLSLPVTDSGLHIDLSHVLGLAFGLRGLTDLEINNFSRAWNIGEAAAATTTPKESDQAESPLSPAFKLKNFTIRGTTFRESSWSASPPPSLSEPEFTLPNLLALIPEYGDLLLRIEYALLLHSPVPGIQTSYAELGEELQKIEKPGVRVRLM